VKIKVSELRRIIREEVGALVGGSRGPDLVHLGERVRRAAERAAQPGMPPSSIARDFFSLVQHEIPGVDRAAATAEFSAAADAVLRGTAEPGLSNLQYTLGSDAAARREAVRPALVDALIGAFENLRGSLTEGVGRMKRGTLTDLQRVEPRLAAYVSAKYRDELADLVVAYEGGGFLSRGKPYVYVPSEDVAVAWVESRPVFHTSSTLLAAIAGV